MDLNSEIGKLVHLIFGFSIQPSSEVNDCSVEDLISNQSLTENQI